MQPLEPIKIPVGIKSKLCIIIVLLMLSIVMYARNVQFNRSNFVA
jgi:hypothetical protein